MLPFFISGMRKPYKGERDVFDLNDLVSKEPFGNFDQWFKLACQTPGILEANAMTLATASKYSFFGFFSIIIDNNTVTLKRTS